MTGLTVPTPRTTKQLMKLIEQDYKQRAYFVTGRAAAAILQLSVLGQVLSWHVHTRPLRLVWVWGDRGHQRGRLQQHLLLCRPNCQLLGLAAVAKQPAAARAFPHTAFHRAVLAQADHEESSRSQGAAPFQ